MKVRPATHSELGRVMELSLGMRRESPIFCDAPYEPATHFAWLQEILNNDERLLLVAEIDDTIIGFFIGGMNKYFFNSVKYAEDYSIYVSEEYRGATAGKALIKEYEKWAAKQGAQECYLGSNIGIQVPRFVKLLEALGYSGPGVTLSKRIN